ncbi:hypothetical protein MUB24_01815 [Lederbergia sp. NSJ-179]|uniref:hypothetical protein n=1 Tax=Lederbergia sp. NSJ-179 TaxID=2931402 RepID=UPI001FD07134|nr:hypothetical protein [Lederbergia sp. NSJ-179]MCJ7839666.1 hypothetical protein [Lederbergia sp. NSJ-179]
MISVLIFLLFILNALLIFAVVLLFMRQNRLMEMETAQKKVQAETEELMTSFLLEIKEENQRYLSKLDERQKGISSKDKGELNREKEEQIVGLKKEAKKEKQPVVQTKNFSKMQAENAYNKNNQGQLADNKQEEKKENSTEIKRFTDQVHSLHSQGMSSEEIAQRLNRGKTEVNLALKFKDMHT